MKPRVIYKAWAVHDPYGKREPILHPHQHLVLAHAQCPVLVRVVRYRQLSVFATRLWLDTHIKDGPMKGWWRSECLQPDGTWVPYAEGMTLPGPKLEELKWE